MRFSNDPPYSSVARVAERREELVQQVAVRGVDLDDSEAGGATPGAAASAKAATTAAMPARSSASGHRVARRERNRARRRRAASRPRLGDRAAARPTAVASSPCVPRAPAGCRHAAPCSLDEARDAAPAARRARPSRCRGRCGGDAALGRDGGGFGHDQRRPAHGPAAEVDQVPVVGEAVGARVLAHGAHDHAVVQLERAECERREQRRRDGHAQICPGTPARCQGG